MEDTLIKALIAASGVIAGAVITAFASAYSSRQKIRAIELQYQHKLHEGYLAAARQYTNSVYVPLSIALERLRKAYEDLRIAIDFKKQVAEPRALDRFKDSITQYVEEVSGLLDAGADAFLTTALEERLRAFNAFVAVSKDANEVSRRTVLAYRLPWASLSDVHEVRGKMAKMLGGSRISASVWGVGLEILPDALLGAPLASRDFEKEMLSAVGELKQLIKEVTLGAQQPPRGA